MNTANSKHHKATLEKTQTSKTKIAFIHDSFPFGGGEIVTSTLATYLAPLDYQVIVFAHHTNEPLLTANDHQYLTVIKTPRADIYDDSTHSNLIGLPAKLGFPFALSLSKGDRKPLWFDKLTTNGFPYFKVSQEVYC